MNIEIIVEADDDDVDESHDSGLTTEAYDRLCSALMIAGFSIVDGPNGLG